MKRYELIGYADHEDYVWDDRKSPEQFFKGEYYTLRPVYVDNAIVWHYNRTSEED